MKEKWTETAHCEARAHCRSCLGQEGFRKSITDTYDWDGTCPHGVTLDNIPAAPLPPKMPPLKNRVKNFAKSMRQAWTRFRKTGEIVVSEEVFEERMAICKSNPCKKFNEDRMVCLECGCALSKKLSLVAMACPLDYWKEDK